MPGSVGLLLDVTGIDHYWDYDSPFTPARGFDKCVSPKYAEEDGYGQQRDASGGLQARIPSLMSVCFTPPFP